MGPSIDPKPRIPRCNQDISVAASREPLVKINLGVIRIVEKEQPVLYFAAKPLQAILWSAPGTFTRCNIPQACLNGLGSTSVDEEDVRESESKLSLTREEDQ
jgi:hypothetical protein